MFGRVATSDATKPRLPDEIQVPYASLTPNESRFKLLQRLQWFAMLTHLSSTAVVFALIHVIDKGWWTLRMYVFGREAFVAGYRFSYLLPVFPFLSFFAHGWVIGHRSQYEANIRIKLNDWRWIEYSLSAGVMIFVLASLCGVDDVRVLVCLLGLNALLMWFGSVADQAAREAPTRRLKAFGLFEMAEGAALATHIGWLIHLLIWGVIFASFFYAVATAKEAVPDMVWVIAPVLFFLHSLFGVVQLAYLTNWRGTDFVRAEILYTLLSITAKTLLVGLSLGGAMRDEDEVE